MKLRLFEYTGINYLTILRFWQKPTVVVGRLAALSMDRALDMTQLLLLMYTTPDTECYIACTLFSVVPISPPSVLWMKPIPGSHPVHCILKYISIPVCVCVCVFISVCADCFSSKGEDRLFRRLFRRYNQFIRPVENVSDPVTVEFEVSMSQLVKVVRKPVSTASKYLTCFLSKHWVWDEI